MNYSGKGLSNVRLGDVRPHAGAWVGGRRPQPGSATGHPSRETSMGGVRRQIAAKSMRGIELVPVLDVRCFLAHQKYVTAFHGKGETIITDSLRDLEAEFADAFLRVHRSALVSIGFIEGFERQAHRRFQLRLAGVDRHIPVSRRHAPAVRRQIEAMAGPNRRGQRLEQQPGRGPEVSDRLPLASKSNLHSNDLAWRTASHG